MCDCNYGFGMHERHIAGLLHFNTFHSVIHTIKCMEDLQLTQWLHFHIAVKHAVAVKHAFEPVKY